MIISHAKAFIMLAPWKTASQTCHASLAAYNESRHDRFFHFNADLGRVVHQHVTLGDFLALPEARLGYKLAAFVRNPYDRAYSGFVQLQRDFQTQPKASVEPHWVQDLIKVQIAENMARIIAAEFDFNKWIALLPEYEIFDSGRNTNMPLHPAHYWTHSGDEVIDFIGKTENFTEDFSRFCHLVDIETPDVRTENASDQAPHPMGYSRYAGLMSRSAIDRLNRLFARDFELFGYQPL